MPLPEIFSHVETTPLCNDMTSNMPNLEPGEIVAGRFRIVKAIGSGGFSVVYLAYHEEINRKVALKILKPQASADESIVERFRREALYASRLSHPNTIKLYDYGQSEDGMFYIAMEYLVGTDLSALVQNGDPVDLKRVWKVLAQTCRSLAEAHRIGLVHRDLKPENIFLAKTPRGEMIKVLDFGVSKTVSDFSKAGPRTLAPLTIDGTVFGTPLYMAPEQAMAEPITPAVDVYALGHIAFEMITGRAAYGDSDDAMTVMLRQINEPALELPAPWNATPFAGLINACTQKDPAMRLPDASAMLRELEMPAFFPYTDTPPEASFKDLATVRLPSLEISADPMRLRFQAQTAMQEGKHQDAMNWFEKACEVYRTTGPARHYIESIAEMGYCATLLKMPRRAEGILLQGLAHAKQLNTPEFTTPGLLAPSTLARLEYYLGISLVQQARFDEAREFLQRAAAMLELTQSSAQAGHQNQTAELAGCLKYLGYCGLAQGQYDFARKEFQRVLELPRQAVPEELRTDAQLGIIACLAATGELQAAQSYTADALGQVPPLDNVTSQLRLQWVYADLCMAVGNEQKAKDCFTAIFEQAHQALHTRIAYNCLIRKAYLAFDGGDDVRAYEKLYEAGQYAQRADYIDGLYAARAHTIYLHLLSHDFDAQGKAFHTLLDAVAVDEDTHLSGLLSAFFRIDICCARGDFKFACQLLERARSLAALIEDFGLFVALNTRARLLQRASDRSDTLADPAVCPGTAIPPETGRRCFNTGRLVQQCVLAAAPVED